MYILIFLISLIIFADAISYAIYEIKNNQNKFGGICIIVLSVVALIFPTVMIVIR